MWDLWTFSNLSAFLTLTLLEIILGVDNIVLIAIVTSRLPKNLQSTARRVGLFLAMIQRILLLALLSWIVKLSEPLFSLFQIEFSGRDLILLGGGIFLVGKATYEIHHSTEQVDEEVPKRSSTFVSALIQITLLDIVFSLDKLHF